MKKTYIIPTIDITMMSIENMIAVSGPPTSDTPADPGAGMEVKQQGNYYGESIFD